MSYHVLARKWRPRTFRELVGQEHVLKALVNALDQDRLHHAYLFTGTRGVGKTTIARILAKCLNCETGVTSVPCDQCSACQEISSGHFVDLIEVDAASRTRVEDTRELLDNVQYAPSKGRFKVYLIDEVHMLSGHSFNALLKTLEEPPPHVKFLLATTDPQKLPVTILSRCLQFNLKNMSPERIVDHLTHILEREMIPCETSALWLLGRSADGSMRDALSLTDQAIAFGNGKLVEEDVRAMLGTIDQGQLYELLTHLSNSDGQQVLTTVAKMAEHAADFSAALGELISVLHRIAIAQVLPESVDNTFGDKEDILRLAQELPGEDVQLFYQTALLGRRDLPLAPEPRIGFEMVLLRMLAFRPEGVGEVPSKPLPTSANPSAPVAGEGHTESPKKPSTEAAPSRAADIAEVLHPAAKKPPVLQPADNTPTSKPEPTTQRVPEEPPPIMEESPAVTHDPEDLAKYMAQERPAPAVKQEVKVERAPAEPPKAAVPPPTQPTQKVTPKVQAPTVKWEGLNADNWADLVDELALAGVIKNTAMNCVLQQREGSHLQLLLDENNSTLYDDGHGQRLQEVLMEHFGCELSVTIELGVVSTETPAARAERRQAERQAEAEAELARDPLLQDIINQFGATLNKDSIRPIDH